MTTTDIHEPPSSIENEDFNPDSFAFRGLHPSIALGTASDRYAGWLGQIYSPDRYAGRITARAHKVGGKSFREQVLPVDSLLEYFEHFSVLELDYTFYGLLLDETGRFTATHAVLRSYCEHLPPGAQVLLKVPQVLFAQKIRRAGQYVANPGYLDNRVFKDAFFQPAVELLGEALAGFIFEQEYQRRNERLAAEEFAESLDRFFGSIPEDARYHVELRTESYLKPVVFEVLERHGIGQVLSRWTWLPPLSKQFTLGGGRFLNRSGQCVVRLMTPIGKRYEDAYAMAFPFDAMVEGLFQPALVEETVRLMQTGIDAGVRMNIIINNRAGGNAPLIAREIARRFIASPAHRESPGP